MKRIVFLLLGFCLLAVGCGPRPTFHYAPRRTQATLGGDAIETKAFVPLRYAEETRFAMGAVGYYQAMPEKNRPLPVYRVRIRIKNDSRRRIEIRRSGTRLVDDEGTEMLVADAWVHERRGEILVADPGATTMIDLFFEAPRTRKGPGDKSLGARYDFSRIASCRLFWSYSIGDEIVRHETKFIRRRDPHGPHRHRWNGHPYYWSRGAGSGLQPHRFGVRVGIGFHLR